MTQRRDHEPLRWRDQSESEKEIWSHFKNVQAKTLVVEALRKDNLTYFDLFLMLLYKTDIILIYKHGVIRRNLHGRI